MEQHCCAVSCSTLTYAPFKTLVHVLYMLYPVHVCVRGPQTSEQPRHCTVNILHGKYSAAKYSRLLTAADSGEKTKQNAAALTANTCHHILAVSLLDNKVTERNNHYPESQSGESTAALSRYHTELTQYPPMKPHPEKTFVRFF